MVRLRCCAWRLRWRGGCGRVRLGQLRYMLQAVGCGLQ